MTDAGAIFSKMKTGVEEQGGVLVKQVNGIIQFKVSNPDFNFVVDLKNGDGNVYEGEADRADLTLSISDENFGKLAAGTLNAQSAFMQGKIKIRGNMGLAMKLPAILKAAS